MNRGDPAGRAGSGGGAGDDGPVTGSVLGRGAALDPIFEGKEPEERPTKRATLLFQFFLFPLLIVVAAVAVAALFGAIAGGERTPNELLDSVMSGGENAQKQDMYELAASLARERGRVVEKAIEPGKAFYADPAFRSKLLAAFEESFGPEKTAERQEVLARCVALVGDPAALPLLAKHLGPQVDAAVKTAVVEAIGALEPSDGTRAALLRAAKDDDDAVRNHAVLFLSKDGGDEVLAALRAALADTSLDVKLTAASALARKGDASVKDVVANLLDPAWVQANLVEADRGPRGGGADVRVAARRAALVDGIEAARSLHADDLKRKVEALARDGDEFVRTRAKDALSAWNTPR